MRWWGNTLRDSEAVGSEPGEGRRDEHRPQACGCCVCCSQVVSETGWERPVANWEMKLVSRPQRAADRSPRFILNVVRRTGNAAIPSNAGTHSAYLPIPVWPAQNDFLSKRPGGKAGQEFYVGKT